MPSRSRRALTFLLAWSCPALATMLLFFVTAADTSRPVWYGSVILVGLACLVPFIRTTRLDLAKERARKQPGHDPYPTEQTTRAGRRAA